MGVPSPFVTAKQSPFLIAKQRALQPSAFPELPEAVEMSPSNEKAACVITDKNVPVMQLSHDEHAPAGPHPHATFADQAIIVRKTFLERAEACGSPLPCRRRRADSDWTGLPAWEIDALAAELAALTPLPPAWADTWGDDGAQAAGKWCDGALTTSPSKDSAASTTDSERPDSATSSDASEERREDPDDEVAYTLAEFCQKYGARFQYQEILEYWECLEPIGRGC